MVFFTSFDTCQTWSSFLCIMIDMTEEDQDSCWTSQLSLDAIFYLTLQYPILNIPDPNHIKHAKSQKATCNQIIPPSN